MVARSVAAVSGIFAAGVSSWSVLSSLDGLRHYSLRRNFISELAVPLNPHAGRINLGFELGGALVLLFGLVVALRARSRSGRAAALLTAAAGGFLITVGVYPLTDPWIHLGGAIGLGLCALAGGLVAAVAAHRATRGRTPELRRFGDAARVLAWLLVLVLVAGLGYFLWVSATVWPGSVAELFRVLPSALRVQLGGEVYNPLAIAEWIFFGLLLVELVAFAAAEATGLSDRARAGDVILPAGV